MQNPDAEVVAACRDRSRLPHDFSGEARVGDLRNNAYTDGLLRDIDAIVHAAAWTALWNHKKRSDELFLKPTLSLIEAARDRGVKRFVFVSTISAADRKQAADPMSREKKRSYWPHEANVVTKR
jgi:nucleoside-diphosphate-sugar epimerase